jgi:hypothetical protein
MTNEGHPRLRGDGVRGACGSSVPLIIEADDLRLLTLSRAWCGLFQNKISPTLPFTGRSHEAPEHPAGTEGVSQPFLMTREYMS